jgi:hypothetical protein
VIDSAAIMRSPSFSRSCESRTMMNSPFSIVSHVVSRDVRSARSRGLWGLGNWECSRGLYSLKAAIESSIESNCCAISVDEGILGNRRAVICAPHCAIRMLMERMEWNRGPGGVVFPIRSARKSGKTRIVRSRRLASGGSVIADRSIRNVRDASARGAGR